MLGRLTAEGVLGVTFGCLDFDVKGFGSLEGHVHQDIF